MQVTVGNITINAGVQQSIGLAKALFVLSEATSTGVKSAGTLLNKLGIASGKFRKGVADTDFPVMYSIHGIDVWNETKSLLAAGTISNEDAVGIVVLFNEVIRRISENEQSYPTITPAQMGSFINSYNEWATKVNTAVLTSGSEEKLTNSQVQDLKTEFKAIQKTFAKSWKIYAKPGSPTIKNDLARIKALLGEQQTSQEVYSIALEIGSVKIATTSFSNFRTKINDTIKETWAGYSKALKPTKDSPKEIYAGIQAELASQGINATIKPESLTKIFNWGHTATQSKQGARQILTAKLLSQLISVRSLTTDNLNLINLDFQKETGQINTTVKTSSSVTTQDEQTVLELVIESGIFQSVAVQREAYNRVTLGQKEQEYNFQNRVKNDPKFRQALGITDVDGLLVNLINQRASPSFVERIVNVITGNIAGENLPQSVIGKKTTSASKKQKYSVLAPKVTVNTKAGRTPTVQKVTTVSVESNAPRLQTLLDAVLTETIKRNMGTGNRRDILNLRSGRFAESVQVQRVTESRQGAITAFYTYQRNPYATFSRGGKQEKPYTRDPKLLISGSIRQIAKQLAINNLRAQLI